MSTGRPTATTSSARSARNGGAAVPVRLQRRRTKGYRLPPDAVYVGRPSRWGNPYRLEHIRQALGPAADYTDMRQMAVDMYRDHLERRGYPSFIEIELRGKNLVCWCPESEPCHADVLLELANR